MNRLFTIATILGFFIALSCNRENENLGSDLEGAWQFNDSFFYWEAYFLPDTFYLFNDRVGQVVNVNYSVKKSKLQQIISVRQNTSTIVEGTFAFEESDQINIMSGDTVLSLFRIATQYDIIDSLALRSFLEWDKFEMRKNDFLKLTQ